VIGTIESYKAVSDVYSPLSGTIVEVNESLVNNPGNVNKSPYEEGWMARIKVNSNKEVKELLSLELYEKLLEEEKKDWTQ